MNLTPAAPFKSVHHFIFFINENMKIFNAFKTSLYFFLVPLENDRNNGG